MEHHDGGCRTEYGFPVHIARLNNRGVERSGRHNRRPDHAVLRIEQHDTELLGRARPERRQQVGRGVARHSELHACARCVRERPSPKLESREHLRRLGRTNARNPRQLARGRSHEPVEPALRPQQFVGDAKRARARPATAEHERHQLVVAERRRAVAQQFLARAIVGRELSHRTTENGDN